DERRSLGRMLTGPDGAEMPRQLQRHPQRPLVRPRGAVSLEAEGLRHEEEREEEERETGDELAAEVEALGGGRRVDEEVVLAEDAAFDLHRDEEREAAEERAEEEDR